MGGKAPTSKQGSWNVINAQQLHLDELLIKVVRWPLRRQPKPLRAKKPAWLLFRQIKSAGNWKRRRICYYSLNTAQSEVECKEYGESKSKSLEFWARSLIGRRYLFFREPLLGFGHRTVTIVCGGHRATGLATLQWHRYYGDWHEIHFGLWPIRETARPIAKVRPGETIWHLSWPRKTTVQSSRWHWLLVNATKSRHLNHIFSQQPVSILWSFSTNKCCHTAAGIGNRKLCANELASKKCKCKELLEKKGFAVGPL